MTHTELINIFKDDFSIKNDPLDFRADRYINNNYGLTPCISYDRAKKIVFAIYDWAHDIISDNKGCFLNFDGWEYNLDMEIEKLRSSTVKMLIDCIINDLVINYKKPEFSIVSVEYDIDIGGVVETKLNGLIETFYVQLTGGEHSPQMGCQISTSLDDDIDQDDYPGFDFNRIIKAAENSYKNWVAQELDDGSNWVNFDDIKHYQISPTSYSKIVIEKNTDPESVDQFRTYPENNGFTQPNDYSSLPDFSIEYFASLDALLDFYNNNGE